MIELAVDLSVPSAGDHFREVSLARMERSSRGARSLLVMTLSSVPDQRMRQYRVRSGVQEFLDRSFPGKDPVPRGCTAIFEVPGVPAAELVFRGDRSAATGESSKQSADEFHFYHRFRRRRLTMSCGADRRADGGRSAGRSLRRAGRDAGMKHMELVDGALRKWRMAGGPGTLVAGQIGGTL